MSTYVSVVISPATTTRPVVISVSQATRPVGVVREDGVEHRVRDLVGDLVRVALGDRLRREEKLSVPPLVSLQVMPPATSGFASTKPGATAGGQGWLPWRGEGGSGAMGNPNCALEGTRAGRKETARSARRVA